MDSTQNVKWNQKLWDVISLFYWAPKYVGLASIPEDKYPTSFDPKALKLLGEGYRLYGRTLKSGAFIEYLRGQEEILNLFFNIAFAIAPDDVLSRLLCRPLDIEDHGTFESFGGEQLAERYGFGKENVTQPDGYFATKDSLVAVELKLSSLSWPEQIAKYVALMRWEQKKTGLRDNLGLLFILPEKAVQSNWSKVGLNNSSASSVRRCPTNFFDRLDQGKLPARVRKLFRNEEGEIRRDFEHLHLAAVSWKWLRDEIAKIESELDCSARGDQTLKRLLAGLRDQIEAHGKTGISVGSTSS
jgi:hypothetical protein